MQDVHLRRWFTYFSNKDHEVHVITFNPDVGEAYGPVEIHVIKKLFPGPNPFSRLLSLIPLMVRLRSLINQINPDMLHVHSATGYAWTATLTGFHPLIITPWGSDVLIDIQESRIKKLLTRISFHRAELIHCDGNNTRDAVEKLGISKEKTLLIAFGVDIQRFKPSSNNSDFRTRHRLSRSRVVVSTRTLTAVHNVESFVRSIPTVLRSNPDTKFVIVGNGPEREYLVNLANSLDIAHATRFLGKIEEDEMIACLQASNVYVSTSLSESGLASSTAEAMACELPVVNTNSGDIESWIRDGEGGFIVPLRNPGLLAEKIVYLLSDEQRRIQYGKVNRGIIKRRNNYHIEMGKMERTYTNLVNHGNAENP